MNHQLDDGGLDLIFRTARTYPQFSDQPVSTQDIKAIYDLAKWGATSANCCPLRILFIQGEQAKTRLLPLMSPGNKDKVASAPVTAICAYDSQFYTLMPHLFPHADMHSGYAKNPEKAAEAGHFNATLQTAYIMLAARALGFSCGPMAGFDAAKVDQEFFPDGRYRSILVCNIGHGDPESLKPRHPRLDFNQACEII